MNTALISLIIIVTVAAGVCGIKLTDTPRAHAQAQKAAVQSPVTESAAA